MSQTREIITLQFGNYTNYVCTHWWNIQESGFNYDPSNLEFSDINHDVLFREGQNQRGQVTYTPRMLLVDQNGALQHLSEEGELYEDQTKAEFLSGDQNQIAKHVPWESGEVEVMKTEEEIEKPQYLKDLEAGSSAADDPKNYKFEENVNSWTDFMYSRYHPRSINVLSDYRHSDSENEFDTFTNGRESWTKNDFNEDFLDKTRLYLEECNSCQGFQTLFDCTDGFSGMTIKCLEELKDEYGKAIFAVPIIPSKVSQFKNCDSQMSLTIRVINLAMTYVNLMENSNLFLPLSTMSKGWRDLSSPRKFPGISFLPEDFYQTSSILASYLDTISLRYRTVKNPNYLAGFCSDLGNYGRKLCGAGLAFPLAMNNKEDLIDFLDRSANDKLFTNLSPNTEIGTDRVVQTVCLRGISKPRLKQPLKTAGNQIKMAAFRCDSIEEMVQLFFQCQNYASMAHCTSVGCPMTTRVPFPLSMFDERISSNGFLFQNQSFLREENEFVRSVPVLATAQNSNDLSNTLESLHREADRVKIAKIYRFKETGLEVDEYSEVLNQLLDFKDLYDEKYDL